MYWRLTSKEKPIKKGEIKVFAAWESKVLKETDHCFCLYNAENDKFYSLDLTPLVNPNCWSYIDELPSEDNEPSEE